MPKIVDPEVRRRLVFDAVFEVIAADGVAGASLRAVADRAGLAIGSVRHYFSGHESILIEAAEEMAARVAVRLRAHRDAFGEPADRVEAATALLAELLALTPATRLEVAVWFEFLAAARIRPALEASARRLRGGIEQLARILLTRWGWPDGAELDREVLALSALVDGLAVRTLLEPRRRTHAAVLAVLRRHLQPLATAAPSQRTT